MILKLIYATSLRKYEKIPKNHQRGKMNLSREKKQCEFQNYKLNHSLFSLILSKSENNIVFYISVKLYKRSK